MLHVHSSVQLNTGLLPLILSLSIIIMIILVNNRPNGLYSIVYKTKLMCLCSVAGFKCPVCSKFVSSDEMDLHLVLCLTKPRVTYNGKSYWFAAIQLNVFGHRFPLIWHLNTFNSFGDCICLDLCCQCQQCSPVGYKLTGSWVEILDSNWFASWFVVLFFFIHTHIWIFHFLLCCCFVFTQPHAEVFQTSPFMI